RVGIAIRPLVSILIGSLPLNTFTPFAPHQAPISPLFATFTHLCRLWVAQVNVKAKGLLKSE
ncbi:hypothetical protein N9D72_01790, partial [Porticoccaceae bacterium]|nr:hypothetical protein [Porticoccaceae bacterium]